MEGSKGGMAMGAHALVHQRRLLTPERGASLIEVLVATLIITIVFVAILTGMGASIRLTDYHKQRAQTENVLVSGVERVKAVPKVACATANDSSYTDAARAAATAQGWPAASTVIVSIEYWDGTGYGSTCYDNATNGLPLQRITLRVAHPGGRVVQTLAFVKGPQ